MKQAAGIAIASAVIAVVVPYLVQLLTFNSWNDYLPEAIFASGLAAVLAFLVGPRLARLRS